MTGRKLINQYEIVEEIGRGQHGKVKLARDLERSGYVAIKIIQRFSKKRRLGKLTFDPESKTKKEVAILKKVRHPNIVALLEVIDDPELKKIYLVLEHVELGEIVWRKKGTVQVCLFERQRLEREMNGEKSTEEEEKFFMLQERQRQRRDAQRARINQQQMTKNWSLEYHEDGDDHDGAPLSRQTTHNSQLSLAGSQRYARSNPASRIHSRATSRAQSAANSRAHTPLPEYDIPSLDSDNEDDPPYHRQGLPSNHGSSTALDGQYYGSYDDAPFRGRAQSTSDSIASHMSSIGDHHDALEEDYSYVPCFTIEQARSTFRDTVLGLEYLHYEGIVHRDIKPANILWTKDHRVKISDFGVSYFGRPVREGEPEENVSEADAVDFDDDLELAKTVGTPAFFAPELCYTDVDKKQPKVTEQIDVWSLGVTLYGLIYARLPFLSDDEFDLWRLIATSDVHISKKRLKAVGPTGSHQGPSTSPYRLDAELAFEEVDDDLVDLLRRMLAKDPTERIKLRDVKRHPFTTRGVPNVIEWLEETDPSKKSSGKRIIVDKAELDHAVVPISLLDRARSVLKRTVNNTFGMISRPKSDGSGSRRRAVSSATSSDNLQSPVTPIIRESLNRRASLRGDESLYGSTVDLTEHRGTTEHPLAQSQVASPDLSTLGDPFAAPKKSSVGIIPHRGAGTESEFDTRPGAPERSISTATAIQTVVYRGHSYSKSVTIPTAPTNTEEASNSPAVGPFTDHHGNIFGGYLWRGRVHMDDIQEGSPSRAKSIDYGVFTLRNKHSEPSVALSNTEAPGEIENTPVSPLQRQRPSRSSEVSPTDAYFDKPLPALPSPNFFQPWMVHKYQAVQSNSTPNFPSSVYAASNLDQRPATATRTPEAKTPEPRVYGRSTPESFERAHKEFERKRKLQDEKDAIRRGLKMANVRTDMGPPPLPIAQCPPSPDDIVFNRKQEEAKRAQSSSSMNSTGIISQVASPSDVVSPISSANMSSQEQGFASVPSLPGLLSGGSSLCADPEGDFLQQPGVVAPQGALSSSNTPDTLTPPIINDGETVTTQSKDLGFPNSLLIDDDGYNGDGDDTTLTADDEDDDESDSDDGVFMMNTKRKPILAPMPRRGTNASVTSTETAKKVVMEN